MVLNLYQSWFVQPLCRGSGEETPVDVHQDWISFIGLGLIPYICFLILNPFLVIIILSVYSLLVKGSFKQTKLILLMLSFALAIFYASRNIGVAWGSGVDDVPFYLQVYQDYLNDSLASIGSRFLIFPSGNEVLYFSYLWAIGQLLAPWSLNPSFIVYLSQLTLLNIVAYLVSRRYAVIFLCMFFFLMDPNPPILHLWRASFGTLVFMVGMLIYFKENPRTGRIIVFASIGFHLSLALFVFIFELYNFLAKKSNFFLTVMFGALTLYLLGGLLNTAAQAMLPGLEAAYYISDVSNAGEHNFTLIFILIALLLANYFIELSPVSRFATFLFSTYIVFNWINTDFTSVTARMSQIAVPMVVFPLFEIVMKQSKTLIATVIIILLFRAIFRPNVEMYNVMIPEYRNIFYGAFNILFSSLCT